MPKAVRKPAAIRAPLLPLPLVEKLLSAAMSRGAEFGEVYVEGAISTAVSLDEGKVRSAQVGAVTGVGVRAIRGAQVGYAYSDDLDEAALLRTAQTAALIADGTRDPGPVSLSRTPLPTHYQVKQPLAGIDVARKIELVREADAAARGHDRRIKQVMAGYADQTREILVANTLGHLAEDRQDLCRLGVSCVAFELVTVIDDGTVAGGRGSLNVDDEGNPGERKVLIEKGVLKGYLYDHLNAKLTGQRSTGSGRRQSFRHAPMPRMTNTYLAPGDRAPDEIIRAVPKGLYCRQFGGGQVDISNGNFVFEIAEAYLIEQGEITKP